jgi:hypothetical protein
VRTVVALHLAEPSGPSRTLEPVLRRLAAAGELVIALPAAGRAADELGELGKVSVLGHEPLVLPRDGAALAGLPGRLRRDAARFRGLLRRERADLALIATTTLPALTFAARLEGVPAILYATELYRQGARGDALRARAGRAVVRFGERSAAVVVVPSRAVAAQLRAPERAVVAHPSIAPSVAVGDGDALRRAHGLPARGPALATLGNIARGRGQDVAIRALALVRREHPDAHLLVAGEPHPRGADRAYAAELHDLAADLGLARAVRFVGFVRPGDLFAACDVVLNPARFAETFGRAALEALVAGRPVVSTAAGAIPEVLTHARHALLVPPDRPDAMAEAIVRLQRDPDLARRLVDTGRSHVLSTFTAERQLDAFGAAMAVALRGRRG